MLKIRENASDENTVTGYMWQKVLNNIGSQIRLYNGEKAERLLAARSGVSAKSIYSSLLYLMERVLWLEIYLNFFFVVVDRLAFSTAGGAD